MHTDWHGSLKLRDHLLDKLDNLKIVLKLVNVRLHLVNGLALFGHKLFVVHDILFNSVKEQMHGFLLLSLNRSNVLCKCFHICWPVDLDFVVFALLD